MPNNIPYILSFSVGEHGIREWHAVQNSQKGAEAPMLEQRFPEKRGETI